MAFEKLKELAKKSGHTHLSLEFLMEFKECVPEFQKFMGDAAELLAPAPSSDMEDCDEPLEGWVPVATIDEDYALYADGSLDIEEDRDLEPDFPFIVMHGKTILDCFDSMSEAQKFIDDHTA